jgi:hypothetical protein
MEREIEQQQALLDQSANNLFVNVIIAISRSEFNSHFVFNCHFYLFSFIWSEDFGG